MINDITPQPAQDDAIPQDDVTQQADAISGHLSGATDGVEHIADNLDKMMENGLNQAEEKLDSFLGGIDKFLGKF